MRKYSLYSTAIDLGIAQAVDLNRTVYRRIPESYCKADQVLLP